MLLPTLFYCFMLNSPATLTLPIRQNNGLALLIINVIVHCCVWSKHMTCYLNPIQFSEFNTLSRYEMHVGNVFSRSTAKFILFYGNFTSRLSFYREVMQCWNISAMRFLWIRTYWKTYNEILLC